jgi:cellulose synthase/poly-beta-1,6-N-acetylglucosamine synthase-like glycosyltransferase
MDIVKELLSLNWMMIFIYFLAIYGIYAVFYSICRHFNMRNKHVRIKPGLLIIVKDGEKFVEFLVKAVGNYCVEYDTLDIVIVDDGSTDETQKLLRLLSMKHPFIKFVRIEPNGEQSPVEAGLDVCGGEVVAVLDLRKRLSAAKAEEAARRFLADFSPCVDPGSSRPLTIGL